jgi:tetratricopeptide (TPR) repeat protein
MPSGHITLEWLEVRASLKEETGDLDGSLADLIKLLSFKPKDTHLLVWKGRVYRKMRLYQEAKRVLEKARKISRYKDPDIIRALSLVHMDMGDHRIARMLSDEAFRLLDAIPKELWVERAELLSNSYVPEDLEDAIDCLTRAIDMDAEDPDLRRRRGALLIRSAQSHPELNIKAFNDLLFAMERHPDDIPLKRTALRLAQENSWDKWIRKLKGDLMEVEYREMKRIRNGREEEKTEIGVGEITFTDLIYEYEDRINRWDIDGAMDIALESAGKHPDHILPLYLSAVSYLLKDNLREAEKIDDLFWNIEPENERDRYLVNDLHSLFLEIEDVMVHLRMKDHEHFLKREDLSMVGMENIFGVFDLLRGKSDGFLRDIKVRSRTIRIDQQ